MVVEMYYADITVWVSWNFFLNFQLIRLLFEMNIFVPRLDDMEDDTAVRQKRPAAHLIYGEPFTMNSVKLSLFLVQNRILDLCSWEGVKVYNEYVIDTVRGGGIEIHWRDNFFCPEEEDYIKIGMMKNFGFFNLQARLVQLCAGNDQDFSKLTALIACFYFIHNDYSDSIVSEYSEGKSLCDDIIEGKFNFPMVHAIKVKLNKEILGEFRFLLKFTEYPEIFQFV